MKPGPLSLYVVGAALLGVFVAAAWALSGPMPDRKLAKLTLEAKRCGIVEPRFALQGGTYRLNHARDQAYRKTQMSCLEKTAAALGVRVAYDKMVIIN
jgi:hypothetical protein